MATAIVAAAAAPVPWGMLIGGASATLLTLQIVNVVASMFGCPLPNPVVWAANTTNLTLPNASEIASTVLPLDDIHHATAAQIKQHGALPITGWIAAIKGLNWLINLVRVPGRQFAVRAETAFFEFAAAAMTWLAQWAVIFAAIAFAGYQLFATLWYVLGAITAGYLGTTTESVDKAPLLARVFVFTAVVSFEVGKHLAANMWRGLTAFVTNVARKPTRDTAHLTQTLDDEVDNLVAAIEAQRNVKDADAIKRATSDGRLARQAISDLLAGRAHATVEIATGTQHILPHNTTCRLMHQPEQTQPLTAHLCQVPHAAPKRSRSTISPSAFCRSTT